MLPAILRGKLIRHLFYLFIILGLIPTLLLTIVPAVRQIQTTREAARAASEQIDRQAQASIRQLASMSAARYDMDFEEVARLATTLADYAALALEKPQQYAALSGWDLLSSTRLTGSGWRSNGPDDKVGLIVSPLARLDAETMLRQEALAAVRPLMQSMVNANPHIRSAFITTADQTLWLYPNDFWSDGVLSIHSGPDLTSRPYYNETTQVVFSGPYVDMEPVITIAAPVWVDGKFQGMAGFDFTLAVVLNDLLETNVGEQGFMFLLGRDGQVFGLPDRALGMLVFPGVANTSFMGYGMSLYDIVPASVEGQFRSFDVPSRLARGDTFAVTIALPQGPAYMAFSPIAVTPWLVAAVQPVADALQATTNLSDTLQQTASSLLSQSMITGIGVLAVVLIGGIITLRRLALPIEELAKGARAISEGRLGYRVPVGRGDDEMTALSRSFNEMAEAVRRMQADVECQREILSRTLEFHQQEIAVVSDVAALINRQTDLPTNLARALNLARTVQGTDILAVSLLAEGNELSLTAVSCEEVERACVVPLCRAWLDAPLTRRVAETRRSACIDFPQVAEADASPEMRHGMERLGVRRMAVFPIDSKGRFLGVLTLMRHDQEEIADREKSFRDTLLKLLAVLIDNAQLQSRMRTLSIMEERRRLARELHDSATQSLFTLSLAAQGLKETMANAVPEQERALDMLLETTRRVQVEMRTLINELRPVDLEADLLDMALRRHLDGFRHTSDAEAHLTVSGDVRELPWPIQRNLNRIAQEALSNIARHAHAHHVTVDLKVEPSVVNLTIRDDGIGFDVRQALLQEAGSLGLSSMRERAEMMDGTLTVRSLPTEGTVLAVKVPLHSEPKLRNG